jgi:4-amino-4-deoxy-L-arabinose transferase-like glycosyltransferase
MELDEAEQALFSQWLQWGYSSQPPLYTWLQKAFFAVFGEGLFALSLLKNSLLFLTYVFVYLAARRTFGDERRAFLTSLGLLLIPPIAWASARDLTHTVLVAASVAANFYIALRLIERPAPARYGWFGLSVGLGLLSKYSFALHVLALSVALASIPRGRVAVLDRRMGLALGLAVLVCAPHGWWMWHHDYFLHAGLHKLMSGDAPGRIWLTARVGSIVLIYAAPLLLACLFLFPGLQRGLRHGLAHGSFEPSLPARYFLALSVTLLLFILLFSPGQIKTRWLYPFFVLFPLFLFASVPAAEVFPSRFRIYLGLAATSAVLVLGLLMLRVPGASWTHRATDLNLPFAGLANHLRKDGFMEGIIIGNNTHIAGNLRLQFPNCQTFDPRPGLPFPPEVNGDVLVVWEAPHSDPPPDNLLAHIRQHLNVTSDTLPVRYLSLPYRYSPDIEARFGVALLHKG